MKKIIFILLITVTCLSIASCDISFYLDYIDGYLNNEDGNPSDDDQTTTHVHEFGEWKVVKEADEFENGREERVCACGEKETKTIEKTYVSLGLQYALNQDGKGYSVVGIGNCTDTDIVIPGAYNGLTVTDIGVDAFKGNTTITSVTTGSSVTNIESYAFCECQSLKKIILSDSLVSIQEYAFKNCASLTDLFGGVAFEEFSLTSFYYCNALSNIVADEQNPYYTTIDGNIYDKSVSVLIRYGAGKSATHFEIPDTVKTIGDQSLYAAVNLTSVTIPNSVTSIGSLSFSDCISLKTVTIPDSVTNMGSWAFAHCESLEKLTI